MAAGGPGMKTRTYTITRELPSILREVHVRSVESLPRQFFDELYGQDLLYTEKIYVLYMNGRLKPLSVKLHGQGCINACLIDVPAIVREAILLPAPKVMLMHNHPSGNTNPSVADRTITKELAAALKLFKYDLVDHLIVTENEIYSFKEEGLI